VGLIQEAHPLNSGLPFTPKHVSWHLSGCLIQHSRLSNWLAILLGLGPGQPMSIGQLCWLSHSRFRPGLTMCQCFMGVRSLARPLEIFQ
jgi:hypothetical protein